MFALTLAVTWLVAIAGIGRAHGGGTPQLSDVPAGPFRLFVWTSPDPWRAGDAAHVTVAVTRVDETGQTFPVENAAVEITLSPAEVAGQPIVLSATAASGAGAGFYEDDTTLPQVGEWNVSVRVSDGTGAGEAQFVNQVLPGAQPNWLLWIGGGLVIILAAIGYIGTRRRKQPVARSRSGAVQE